MRTTPEHMALPPNPFKEGTALRAQQEHIRELEELREEDARRNDIAWKTMRGQRDAAEAERDALRTALARSQALLAERDAQVDHWSGETFRLRDKLRNLAGAADWYRRCLEDIQDRKRVTGLQEAKLTYDRAYRRATEEIDD